MIVFFAALSSREICSWTWHVTDSNLRGNHAGHCLTYIETYQHLIQFQNQKTCFSAPVLTSYSWPTCGSPDVLVFHCLHVSMCTLLCLPKKMLWIKLLETFIYFPAEWQTRLEIRNRFSSYSFLQVIIKKKLHVNKGINESMLCAT